PQMQEKLREQSQLQALKMENNMSELILALEATHRWKYLSQKEAVDRLKQIQTELRDIIKIIKTKVKK
ncbi:MAG: hypothetical protein KDC69_12035, partial [Flavobacteriaceae bacterium]|nr:hypothetical protein [Flavobacteriaceae bacterium]